MLSSREACYYACHISGWQLTKINLFKILYIASVSFARNYNMKLIKKILILFILKQIILKKLIFRVFII